jgi:hypothetical protein
MNKLKEILSGFLRLFVPHYESFTYKKIFGDY